MTALNQVALLSAGPLQADPHGLPSAAEIALEQGELDMKKLIKGGTVVTAGDTLEADVLIQDGVVKAVGAGLDAEGAEVIDASGLLVMPGGIDPHTHLEMPFGGTVSSDDFFTGHRAAAFGGTTCHIDFALQSKGETLKQGIQTWKKRAEGKAAIDYGFHIAVTDPTDATIAEIPTIVDEGVTSLKVFMAYKGVFQVDDTAFLNVLKSAEKARMLTMVHAENGDAIAMETDRLLAEGKTGVKYHNEAHSAIIEAEATSRAVDFVEMTGAPLYVVHVASGQGLQAIRRGRRKGLPVMAETCIQYLHLTDQDIATEDFEGAKYICSPPPKTEWDKTIVYECIGDGTIQTVATDHCPFWFDGTKEGRTPGKELGKDSWAKVPNGVPGIEDRYIMLWHFGVNSGLITPEEFVALSSANAAKIFGMYPKKGTIAVGADADIVIFDPTIKRTVTADKHHMNIDYNCYEGIEVEGWPVKVLSRGEVIVDGDKWLGSKGRGQFVPRETDGAVL